MIDETSGLILAVIIIGTTLLFVCTTECAYCKRPILRRKVRLCKLCRLIAEGINGRRHDDVDTSAS